MKIISLNELPYEAVSHDPGLKKKVLLKGTLPYVKHISHIVFQPGSIVSEHSHAEDVEVLYCIKGKALFLVNGENVFITEGSLLIVDPGEVHSITDISEETEFLYFRTTAP